MKRIFWKPAALLFTMAVLFSGCATIVSKTSYRVYIHTDPPRATVTITNKKGREVFKGASPATVKLNSGAGYFSKGEYQVKISLVGFEEKIVPINFKLNNWYFGNLLIGGVLGLLIIDPATGAMWKIKDPVIDETLIKTNPSATTAPTLKIINIEDVPDKMKEALVRLN
ncbi:MAG: hypothetical protein ACXWWC_01325 [Chitinophagaceae bacterium]